MRKPKGIARYSALTMLVLAGLSTGSAVPVITQSAKTVEARESNSDKSTRIRNRPGSDRGVGSMLAVNGGSSVIALPGLNESPAQVSSPGANGKIVFSRSLSISEVYAVNVDGSNQINLTNSQGFDNTGVWSPDGARIAFESGRDGNGEIYVMNSDGSNLKRLTNDPAGDYGPVWSPDSSKIAFVSYRNDSQQIYVMNADGSNLTRLTNPPGGVDGPVWSPDGSRIAFTRWVSESNRIYVMNADGSNQMRLTDGLDHTEDTDPVWSPDGSRIAFARWQVPEFRRAIYVINADGSNETRLTPNIGFGNSYAPAWSPDGRKIVFESEVYDYVYVFLMNADGSNLTRLTNEYSFSPAWSPDGSRIAFIQDGIYLMNADGSGQTRITNNSPGFDSKPRWSPDGVRITFTRHISIEPDIYVMNSDGSDLINLTNHPGIDRHPSWSPDGSKIAFVSYRDIGFINIYVMNADGSGQTRITSLPGFNIDPDWSPDGTKIAFAHSHNGDNAIYVMNPDGSNLTRLTDPGTLYGRPAWSPDGNRIAFARFHNSTQEIYVMNADGSGQINLTNNQAFDSSPSWSPDGSKIVFEQIQNPSTDIFVMNSDGSNQTKLTDNSPGFEGQPAWAPDGSSIAFISSRFGTAEIYVMNPDGSNPTRLTQNLDAYNLDPDWHPLSAAPISTVQFTSGLYSVGEEAGNVVITVERTGDVSSSATVTYATHDGASLTNCQTINGAASSRCDYATAYGTLQFAAGETTKAIALSVVDDSYTEGPETLDLTLSNSAGAILGGPSVATITIRDNDNGAGANPIRTTTFFVRQHYLDFLSREPEPSEPWSGVLNNCSDVNNNPACDRLTVSEAFFGSPEFQLKGYFVFRFYKLAFNRLPTYTEIVNDMRAVTGGTANEVFQKKALFTNSFVTQPEFVNHYGTLTDTQYVAALLGRYALTQITTPDPATPDGTNKLMLTSARLRSQLIAGTLTRAQVLRAIADSDQVFSLEFNRAFVAMQYYGYLRRTPEMAGYNAWLNYLDTHGDSRTMVNGFMNSTEYQLRFGQP